MKRKININKGWGMHCHHGILVEYVYNYEERVNIIKSTKPKNEIKTRLKLFKLLQNDAVKEIPKKYRELYQSCREAVKKYQEADDVRRKTNNSCREANKAYQKAVEAYREANEACWEVDKSWQEAFHKKWCGCKKWDGMYINFNKDKK